MNEAAIMSNLSESSLYNKMTMLVLIHLVVRRALSLAAAFQALGVIETNKPCCISDSYCLSYFVQVAEVGVRNVQWWRRHLSTILYPFY